LPAVLGRKGLREAMHRHEAVEGLEGRSWGGGSRRRRAHRRSAGKRSSSTSRARRGSTNLTFFRAEIVRKLNERIGTDAIDQLVFLARGRKSDEPAPPGRRKKRDHEDG